MFSIIICLSFVICILVVFMFHLVDENELLDKENKRIIDLAKNHIAIKYTYKNALSRAVRYIKNKKD